MLGPAMLGPAARLALGAGELMPAAAGLPGRLLALLGPVLVLGAAALLVLRGLRRGRAAPGPRRVAEEEEEGDGPPGTGGPTARELPALHPEKQRRREQVPMNGQLISSASTREKKLLKPKKKRKARCSDKEVPKELPVEKDKVQEEEGVWQTKISSREKRNLRKERLKQKDPSRAPLGSLAAEPAFDWDEKGAVWPLTEDTSGGGKSAFISKAECGTTLKTLGSIREELAPSQSEEDVFSNVGTWDMAEVRSCPVTFGTLSELPRELDNMKGKSSEDSPSRCCWHASSAFFPADSAWQGQDDLSAIDIDSDWKAPTEEWGNWTGDEEDQTGDKKEKDLPKGKADIHFCLSGLKSKTQRKKKKIEVKEERGGAGLRHSQQGLETRMEEDPRDLISAKHTSDEVCASFRKSLGIANNVPNNSVPGKKERRKRKKMKKET
ncbi:protein LYRIC-like [Heliangelus exortis]|uniref:protein LYRIC-like n=1 Tax=Heliangelus exortis TaxID=472823 RepID=UPI003A9397A2